MRIIFHEVGEGKTWRKISEAWLIVPPNPQESVPLLATRLLWHYSYLRLKKDPMIVSGKMLKARQCHLVSKSDK